MIVDKTIKIRAHSSNITFYKNLGYSVNIGDIVDVKISDLPKKSNVTVNCSCDLCGAFFTRKFSNNTLLCISCNKKTNKKEKPIKISKERIESLLKENTKGQTAKILKTSRSTLEKWIKKYNIDCKKYHGLIKYDDNILLLTKNKIEDYLKYNNNSNIQEICRDLNIPIQLIRKLRKENKIKLNTFFDLKKNNYDDILNNLEFYMEENQTKTLKIIAEENKISIEQLKKAFRDNNIPIRVHSYNKSIGEIEIKEFIRSLGFDCHSFKFEKKYEIDCFVKTKMFGIEYCGEYWHRYEPYKNNKNYHQEKTQYFLNKNITIMTIFESEWKTNQDLIKSMIKTRLGVCDKIYARKCEIKEIDSRIAKEFHDYNHINGYVNSSINIGLFYNNELFSVLSLSKSRFDKTFEYEIIRFSTKRNYNVVGGFSKMFNYFVNKYNVKNCLSYANLRFGFGNVYKKCGFIDLGITAPNYFYYDKKIGALENRMKYVKKKLQSFSNYSDNKTEFQIMSENGYYCLYDCGNKKYGWFSPVFNFV